jgi:hypothetical protein
MLDKNFKPKAAEAKRAQQLADERRREIEKLPWSEIESYANVLIAGYVEDQGDGRRANKYINDDPGGEVWILKERDGRIAMAKLLRSGLPLKQDFLDRLAALFDPDDGHDAIDRKVIFENRSAGHPHGHVRDSAIAMDVCERVLKGATITTAWEEAAEKFKKRDGKKLSPDRIKQIWSAKRKPIICEYIHNRILDGDDETKALEKAERHFGSKKEATREEPIRKIWSNYRKWWEQIEGRPLPGITG